MKLVDLAKRGENREFSFDNPESDVSMGLTWGSAEWQRASRAAPEAAERARAALIAWRRVEDEDRNRRQAEATDVWVAVAGEIGAAASRAAATCRDVLDIWLASETSADIADAVELLRQAEPLDRLAEPLENAEAAAATLSQCCLCGTLAVYWLRASDGVRLRVFDQLPAAIERWRAAITRLRGDVPPPYCYFGPRTPWNHAPG